MSAELDVKDRYCTCSFHKRSAEMERPIDWTDPKVYWICPECQAIMDEIKENPNKNLMAYVDAIIWITEDDGMAARLDWEDDDLVSYETGEEVWTPKSIFLDINANVVLQVGDKIVPYIASEEDKKAQDWVRI